MKFIGHLDVMRYFQKANIRANLDMAYSEGFNPHQIMSFASPLGVGITSEGEYFDIQVHSTKSSKESIAALNATMVDGIKVSGYKLLPDDAKKSMSLIAGANYMVYPKYDDHLSDWDSLEKDIQDFLSKEEITVTKKTKKSETELDIKPFIYEFKNTVFQNEAFDIPQKSAFYLFVSTGSETNIKPELVLNAFYESLGKTFEKEKFQIHRLDMFTKEDDKFISLGDLGEDIE